MKDNRAWLIISAGTHRLPSEQQDITWAPVHVFGADRPSRWLVLCDHATNVIPPFLGPNGLDLSEEELTRHIAYDIGIEGVALRLGEHLNAPVVVSNFSRLVVDPNRGEEDPTLIRQIYDEA
ncbi:MAG: N-formylglutamate amidohydrolase, partial [Pseudomonadota bacterium]